MKTVQRLLLVAALPIVVAIAARASDVPAGVAAPGESHIATVHAEGAQIYECKAAPSGKLSWTFREPVATLIMDGQTVGRHYAGPNWEWHDGSRVMGKAVARAPGEATGDIPLLKLAVTEAAGPGILQNVTTVQRLATRGGVADGDCSTAGALLSVPYAADYVFLRKPKSAASN